MVQKRVLHHHDRPGQYSISHSNQRVAVAFNERLELQRLLIDRIKRTHKVALRLACMFRFVLTVYRL